MFLFLDNESILKGNDVSMTEPDSVANRIWTALFGEERPRDMLLLLTTLVVLLHVWMLTSLMRPVEKITQAVPLVMEVSMIAVSSPKPVIAPPKPVPPPPPIKKPKPPKKIKPKPVKKTVPAVQKAPEFAPVEPVESPPVQSTQSASSSSASTSAQTPASNPEPFTEANFRANYAHNPKPHYPTIAKRRGWQGKVLLRVRVSAQGLSDSVTVEKSSGHEMLDDSAIEAVKKWRFIPAKRGDTPVASSVIVPIVFTLRN